MPVLNPPDVAGPPVLTDPATSAVNVAMQQLGKNYKMGGTGPDVFDCSGLMQYSWLNGPGIQITRTVGSQWSNSTNMTTIVDVNADTVAAQAAGVNPPNYSESDLGSYPAGGGDRGALLLGDILFYFQPGNSNSQNNAHVKMYVGGGQTIEAPHQGAQVELKNVDFTGDTTEPFAGVRRVTGKPGTAGGSGQGSGSNNTSNNSSSDYTAVTAAQMAAYKDPRSNLPFSAYFMGQSIPATAVQAGATGDVRMTGIKPGSSFAPITQLVRGGMMELVAKQFKLYFMMNPQQISSDVGINTSQLSALQQAPDYSQSGGYWVSNQTISFTIYFNRMYEVFQGNVKGPSQEGCRWDIRALERLIGMFDAQAANNGQIGQGNNGWGNTPASTLPLQVVFGGPNSLQFQGVIASLDYYFTLFDVNMIPIEAYADVQVMRIYQPQLVGSDLTIAPLVTTTSGVGPQKAGNITWGKTGPFTQ